MEILKKGNLFVEGTIVKSKKKKFVILQSNGYLEYFKDEKSTKKCEERINLNSTLLFKAYEELKIRISTDTTTVFLFFDSKESLVEWFNALKNSCDKFSNASLPEALSSGSIQSQTGEITTVEVTKETKTPNPQTSSPNQKITFITHATYNCPPTMIQKNGERIFKLPSKAPLLDLTSCLLKETKPKEVQIMGYCHKSLPSLFQPLRYKSRN